MENVGHAEEYKQTLAPLFSHPRPHRPILTHLNTDSSWLISFPVPSTQLDSKQHGRRRAFFHLLVDPWLDTTIVAVARWFMTLKHATKPAFRCMQDVHKLIATIEELAAGSEHVEDEGKVDAVLVTTVLDDHCHWDSLVQLGADTPVITVDLAMKRIRTWKHFTNIELMPEFTQNTCDWRDGSTASLPNWLAIARLPSMEMFPALHFATMINFSTEPDTPDTDFESQPAEALIFSPHGTYPARLDCLQAAHPPIKVLALLHGLDPSRSPYKANLGVETGLAVQRLTGAKYWIPTHDEHLIFGGLNGYLQSKTHISLEQALKDDAECARLEGREPVEDNILFRDIGNGESFVLA